MPFSCQITIRSETRYLALLRQWVAASFSLSKNRRISHKVLLESSLALIEAVDNVILHAHRKVARLPLTISIDVSSSRIVIDVIDTGGGLGGEDDRGDGPSPMSDHGRGLFLIGELMDDVESKVEGGFHILRMTYKL